MALLNLRGLRLLAKHDRCLSKRVSLGWSAMDRMYVQQVPGRDIAFFL